MILPLLGKEIREHGLFLFVLWALSTVLFALIALARVHAGDPAFEGLRFHLLLSVPIVTWTMGGRLVRREYAGGTQLFLDALPVSRSAVVTAKHLLGAAFLALSVLPAFLFCALLATREQDVSLRFLCIVAARTVAVAWFFWSAAFLLGFLGRYRAPLLIVGLFCAFFLLHDTDVELGDFGPLALLDETFAFERNAFPWGTLGAVCAASAGLLGVAYFLAGLREGSVAARLAREMSHRERAFAGVAVLAAIAAAGTLRDKRPKPPFDPPAIHTEERDGVRVVVGAGGGLSEEDARRLAEDVGSRLETMRRDLAIPELVPVYLFARRGLDASRYEHGSIEDEAGVVVRIGYPAPDWDGGRFAGWLAHVLLYEHTHGRALQERRHWVLDGYCGNVEAGGPLDAPLTADARHLARAAHGARGGVTRERLAAWDTFRLEVGDDLATAVAWAGIRTLARTRGADRARAFLAEVLGREPPDDFRAAWYESSHGVEEVLRRTTGTDLDTLLRDWNAELGRAAGAEISELPRIAADVRVVEVSSVSREIELTARLEPAPPAGVGVRFEWAAVHPLTFEPADADWETDETPPAEAAAGRRIRHAFQRGQRIAWRVAFRDEALGCDVTSPVRKLVIE
jgi:hypothetical protein